MEELPVRVLKSLTGMQAVQVLRGHRVIDLMVSRWDLADMTNGALVRLVRAARPAIRNVVLLADLTAEREIAVRNLGVTAVSPTHIADAALRDALGSILGLEAPVAEAETGQGGEALAIDAASERATDDIAGEAPVGELAREGGEGG